MKLQHSPRRLSYLLSWLLVSQLLFVLAGCETDKPIGPQGKPELVSLFLEPTDARLRVGHSIQAVVAGIYTDGTSSPLEGELFWKSENEAIATVSNAGIDPSPLTSDWKDANQSNVAFSQDGHAWGGAWHRIIRLVPGQNLEPGGHYTTSLKGDVSTVNGKEWSLDYSLSFQVACDDDTAGDCPDLGEIPAARLDGAANFKAEWTEFTGEELETKSSSDCSGCTALSMEGPGLLLLSFGYFSRRRRRLT